jgi:hypothetical protein
MNTAHRALTPFQIEGQKSVEAYLHVRGLAAEFECVDGKGETYLVAKVPGFSRRLEIYLYEDEAGFFVNDRWQPFESVDFDSQAQLLEQLLAGLSKVTEGP